MIDRQQLETILSRRFPGGTHLEIAAAANAIMGLADEWEEVDVDLDLLARAADLGPDVRVLRRRANDRR